MMETSAFIQQTIWKISITHSNDTHPRLSWVSVMKKSAMVPSCLFQLQEVLLLGNSLYHFIWDI